MRVDREYRASDPASPCNGQCPGHRPGQGLMKNYPAYKWGILIFDMLSLVMAAFITLWLRRRFDLSLHGSLPQPFPWTKLVLLLLTSVAVVVCLKEKKLYKERYFITSFEQMKRIAECMAYGAVFLIISFFLLRGSYLEIKQSRSLFILFTGLGFILLVLERLVFLRKALSTRWSHYLKRKILIVGSDSLAKTIAATILNNESLSLEVAGFWDNEKQRADKTILGYEVWYGSERYGSEGLKDIVESKKIDEIFIAIDDDGYDRILRIIDLCKQTRVPVSVLSRHFQVISDKMDLAEFKDLQSVVFAHSTYLSRSYRMKRMIDITLSLLLLLILSPLFLILAVLIKLTSDGPVFFRCRVVGKDSKRFMLYKFRTMYQGNNHEVHKELIQKIISGQQKEWKKDEKVLRVTSIGKVLRKFSIDELPQLINVLKGEMSLVGPRQSLEYEYELFQEWHKKRFRVKPGMTGLWQVLGRNEVSHDDMVILDLFYVENWSLYLDLKILLKTIKVVALAKGGI